MTEEQQTYINVWIAKNIHIKEDNWLEKSNYDEDELDHLWYVDEESYQMKKFLQNNLDFNELSPDEKTLCKEASDICSYIDELCGMMLFAKPENWEAPSE